MKNLLILPILLWCTSAMSAEILVMNRDCVSDDAYKQNDVVSVAPDEFYEKSTGYTEANGFHIIHKDGVPEADLKYLEQPLTREVAIENKGDVSAPLKEISTVRLRKYSISDKGIVSEKSVAVELAVKSEALVE